MSGLSRHRVAQREVWFVTRKYPPDVGGMERLSFEMTSRLAARRPACLLVKQSTRLRLPGFIVWAAWRVLNASVQKRVSVLHVGDPVLSPLAVFARAFGVPTIVTIHGLDVVYPRAFYRAYLRCFLRGFTVYVCISEAARSAAVAAGVPADRTRVIGVGMDVTPAEGRADLREKDRLLFIGRLVPRKGLAWFVRDVLPRLVTSYPRSARRHHRRGSRARDHRVGRARKTCRATSRMARRRGRRDEGARTGARGAVRNAQRGGRR